MFSERRRALAVGTLVLVCCAGCGQKGPPLPPEPRGPLPPMPVRARQVGDVVHVGFLVPESRGEHGAQQPVEADVVRVSFPPSIEPGIDPDAFRRRGVIVGTVAGDPLSAGEPLGVEDSTLATLAGGSPWGYTLRYGVRVRDRRGRASPLVVAEDLVTIVPTDPPSELVGEPTSDGVRLSWRAPEGGADLRYNVYRSSAALSTVLEDPHNRKPLETPEYLDATVHAGETYVYRVRVALAEDPPYRESADSNAVTVLAEDRFAPGAPHGLVAVQEGPAVRLFWDPNPERDVMGYRVYRSRAGGAWERVGPDPVERSSYLDEDVAIGERLAYRVSAVDRAAPPNEGPQCDPVDVEILSEPPPLEGEEP